MNFPLIAAGLSVEIGAAMIGKGMKMLGPELAKLLDSPEIQQLANSVNQKAVIKTVTGALRQLPVELRSQRR